MTETTTPSPSNGTPSPKTTANNSQVTVGKPENPQSVFVGMALDMSWRLAAVVLVPIIGGYELDSHLGTTPLITVLGFLTAIGGVVIVMRHTVRAANKVSVPAPNVTAPKVTPTEEKRP